jgi:glycosyltransferase involved in cell wall biosynthesis
MGHTPRSNTLKILVVSDSYFIHTGFANQGRRIAAHLAETHKVGYVGWFAEYANLKEYLPTNITHYSTTKEYASGGSAIEKMNENGEIEFFGVVNDKIEGATPPPEEPIGRVVAFDKYAIASFDWIVGDFKPDIVLTIGDIWMVEPYVNSRFRNCFTLCNYIPVDGGPWPAYTSQSANILDPAINDSNWKEGLQKADHVIAYTHYGKNIINELIDTDNCKDVIPHGFDHTYLYPAKDRAQVRRDYFGRDTVKTLTGEHPNVGDDDVVIGIISRNQPRKQHPALFEAFSMMKDHDKAWIYIHAGIRDCGWNLEDIANRFGIADRVIYNEEIQIGAGIPDSDMWMVYNSCTFTTLPAKGEGWGLSILESMACGVPVSASAYSAHGSPGGWAVGAFQPIGIKAFDCEPITGIQRALVDIDNYHQSMYRMLDPDRQKQLIKKGNNLSKSLRWENVLPKWSAFIDGLNVDNAPYPTREEQLEQQKQLSNTLEIPCVYPPDERPLVSIIMPISMMTEPNYHQIIMQSIRSYENQTYAPIELILVDNLAFGPGMTNMMQDVPHKLLRWPHKYHASKVLNLASKHASGDFLYFTHSDVAIEPEALIHMVNATVMKRDVGLVGPVLINEKTQTAACGYNKNDMDEIVEMLGMEPGTQVVEGISDAGMLIKKETFEQVGGFDETYKIITHDVDLCMRVKKELGLLSYVCDASRGVHYKGLSHLYKPMSIVMWDRNHFMKKHITDQGARIYE